MKGVVFVEFLSFVEGTHGHDMADLIIDDAALPHDGAYTSVGTYPFAEMARLATALSTRTRTNIDLLLTTFGHHLCGRFVDKYPHFFRSQPCLFDFIESIDRYIHVEVHKLYPDAELPRFATRQRTGDDLTIDYMSCRPLEALAEGMMVAAADHYGERVTIHRDRTTNASGAATRFTLRKV